MNTLANKVTLVGNLGSNPEVRTIEKGSKLARLRLATNENYRDAKGQKVQNTQWHNVVAWNAKAEFAEKYLNKGTFIMVQGKLVQRSYTDKDGQTRYSTDVQAHDFMILEKKEG